MSQTERVVIKVDVDFTGDPEIARAIAALRTLEAAGNRVDRRFDKINKRVEQQAKSLDKASRAGNKFERTLNAVTRGFGRMFSIISKINLIGMAADIGLVSLALAGVKVALVAGRFAAQAWSVAMQGVGAAAAGAAGAIGTVAAALSEFQQVNLAPFIGGINQAATAVRGTAGDRLISFFGVEGITGAVNELAKSGSVAAGTFPRILRGLGNFTADAKGLQTLAAAYAAINAQGSLTSETFNSLVGVNPIFSSAIAEIATGQVLTGAKANEVASAAAESGKITAEEFAKALSGELQSTDPFEGQLQRLNDTLFGQVKGLVSRLADTFTNFGVGFLSPLKGAIDEIEGIITFTLIRLGGVVNQFGVESFFPGLIGAFDSTADFVVRMSKEALPKLIGFVEKFGDIWDGVEDFFRNVGAVLKPLEAGADIMISFFGPLFSNLFGARGFGGLVMDAADGFEANAENIERLGRALGDFAFQFMGIFRDIQNSFFSGSGDIATFFEVLATDVMPVARELLGVFRDIAREALPTINDLLRAASGILLPMLNSIRDILGSGIGGIIAPALLLGGFGLSRGMGRGRAMGMAGGFGAGAAGRYALGRAANFGGFALGAGAAGAMGLDPMTMLAMGLGTGPLLRAGGSRIAGGLMGRSDTLRTFMGARGAGFGMYGASGMAARQALLSGGMAGAGALGTGAALSLTALPVLGGTIGGGVTGNLMARNADFGSFSQSAWGGALGGAATGAAFGSIGFLATPVVGAITTLLGAIGGGVAGYFASAKYNAVVEKAGMAIEEGLSAVGGEMDRALAKGQNRIALEAASAQLADFMSQSNLKKMAEMYDVSLDHLTEVVEDVTEPLEKEIADRTDNFNRQLDWMVETLGMAGESTEDTRARLEALADTMAVDLSDGINTLFEDLQNLGLIGDAAGAGGRVVGQGDSIVEAFLTGDILNSNRIRQEFLTLQNQRNSLIPVIQDAIAAGDFAGAEDAIARSVEMAMLEASARWGTEGFEQLSIAEQFYTQMNDLVPGFEAAFGKPALQEINRLQSEALQGKGPLWDEFNLVVGALYEMTGDSSFLPTTARQSVIDQVGGDPAALQDAIGRSLEQLINVGETLNLVKAGEDFADPVMDSARYFATAVISASNGMVGALSNLDFTLRALPDGKSLDDAGAFDSPGTVDGTDRRTPGGDFASDTATTRIGRALGFHNKLSGMGNFSVTSGLRNYNLGSINSDHASGNAYDITGDRLGAYANAVNGMGGFAEMHGSGGGRHLHVVPPIGDTASSRGAGSMGGSGTTVNASIVVNGAQDPETTARAVQRKIYEMQRDAAERR